MLRLGALAVGALGLVAATAVGASAALDRPSETVRTAVVIEAPRHVVWRALTDFDSYGEWNPYITRASGYARAGSVLELRLEPPGGAPQTVEPKVLTVRHLRKLRWQRRALAPGILDQEHEFRLYRLGPKRVRLVHDVRYEGVLAPFADLGEASRGFDLMCAALEQRAKELAPRS